MSDETTLVRSDDPERLDTPEERASVVVYLGDQVRVCDLEKGASLVLGRNTPADMVVRDPSLSRTHLRVSWEDDGVYVQDLDSRNGTWLGGERIQRSRLYQGARVVAGAVTVAVQVTGTSAAARYGIEGHASIKERLQQELSRARSYRRPLSLLVMRALSGQRAHVSQFCIGVREALEPFAAVGVYGPRELLVVLPEKDSNAALARARKLVDGPGELVCGVATFPDCGSSPERLLAAAFEAAQKADTSQPVVAAQRPSSDGDEGTVVVQNPRMKALYELVDRVADADLAVLVLGETGTGKELVARRLHAASKRHKGPLRVLNCAAIPTNLIESVLFGHERGAFTGADRMRKGLFEEAHGGTVFLDEVGELPAMAQAALLRTLETRRVTRVGSSQEQEVDVRLVAATHQDLAAMVEQGDFRRDLLHRLNALTLEVPALRDRREEVVPLAHSFLAQWSARTGQCAPALDPQAEVALLSHDWPGNVRELRNVIERGVAVSDGQKLGPTELPPHLQGGADVPPACEQPAPRQELLRDMDYRDRVASFERDLILQALRQTGGSQREAAELLGLPRRTLTYKIRALAVKFRNED